MSNTIGIAGRLTKDAVQRAAGSNTATSFTVASDTGFGNRKVTTFYNCTYWRKADGIMPYLLKGSQVFVSGEFSLRQYDKDDGTKGSSPDVNVNNIALLGNKQDHQQSPPAAPAKAGPDSGGGNNGADYLDDDIPF
jgi:single-strand DNA-binding protein